VGNRSSSKTGLPCPGIGRVQTVLFAFFNHGYQAALCAFDTKNFPCFRSTFILRNRVNSAVCDYLTSFSSTNIVPVAFILLTDLILSCCPYSIVYANHPNSVLIHAALAVHFDLCSLAMIPTFAAPASVFDSPYDPDREEIIQGAEYCAYV